MDNEDKMKRLEASMASTFGLDIKNYLFLAALAVPSVAVGIILGAFVSGLVGILVFCALLFKDWLVMMIIQKKCDRQ